VIKGKSKVFLLFVWAEDGIETVGAKYQISEGF
jgi:hypothetical protein